jgi:hypothetical protein
MNHDGAHLERAGDDPGIMHIPPRFYLFPACLGLFFLLLATGITAVEWLAGGDAQAHYSAAQRR